MVGSCLDSMIFEVRPDRFYGSVIPAARRRSCGGPAGAAEAVCCKQPQEHRGWPRSAAPRAAGAHGRRCGAATPLPPSASATTPRLRDTTGAVTPPAAPPRSLRARTAPIPDARAAIPAPRAEPEGAARSGAAMAVSGGAGKGGGMRGGARCGPLTACLGPAAQREGGHQGQEADLRGEPRDAALLPPHHPRGLREWRGGRGAGRRAAGPG